METNMNLPIQAAPVMRGQERGLAHPTGGIEPTVAQSQLSCDTVCALVPAQYKALCTQICNLIGPVIFH